MGNLLSRGKGPGTLGTVVHKMKDKDTQTNETYGCVINRKH